MTMRQKEGYVHVGDVLRDALVEDIGAIDWSVLRIASEDAFGRWTLSKGSIP